MTATEPSNTTALACPHCNGPTVTRRARVYLLGEGLTDVQVPHCPACMTDLVVTEPK
jgi:hypothetical protein